MTRDWHEDQEDHENGRGGSIELASGGRFFPLDPDSESILIEDIAHSLARNCRYNGHVPGFYSVAEHSTLMSYAITNYTDEKGVELPLWALLHDATEAYLPDMPRPVKSLVSGFEEAEQRLRETVAEAFDLEMPIPDKVEWMDDAILADEARQLMKSGGEDWYLPEEGVGIEVHGWDHMFAEAQFLRRFADLNQQRGS